MTSDKQPLFRAYGSRHSAGHRADGREQVGPTMRANEGRGRQRGRPFGGHARHECCGGGSSCHARELPRGSAGGARRL
eukprot:scaffold22978_cov68-Phaeocystis_antarctica.AAC.7